MDDDLSWPRPDGPGRLIAVVGAECTGKTRLCSELADRLADATGLRCVAVPEYLREWCDQAGRTPQPAEQPHIAAEQARRLAQACSHHDVVLADTTPLMTAVYHWQVFADASLDAPALEWQRSSALTLLTALDLPWQPDGLQRDGPQVREPVDERLRQLLMGAGLPFQVVAGLGERRVEAALDACTRLWRRQAVPRAGLFTRLSERDAAQPPWPWACEHCDEPRCEHLLRQGLPPPRLLQRR
jgi:nicotinamide riboside kinase